MFRVYCGGLAVSGISAIYFEFVSAISCEAMMEADPSYRRKVHGGPKK